MRVAIDTRKLHDFGIGTYIRNLLRHLARLDRTSEYILLCRPDDCQAIRALGQQGLGVRALQDYHSGIAAQRA